MGRKSANMFEACNAKVRGQARSHNFIPQRHSQSTSTLTISGSIWSPGDWFSMGRKTNLVERKIALLILHFSFFQEDGNSMADLSFVIPPPKMDWNYLSRCQLVSVVKYFKLGARKKSENVVSAVEYKKPQWKIFNIARVKKNPVQQPFVTLCNIPSIWPETDFN